MIGLSHLDTAAIPAIAGAIADTLADAGHLRPLVDFGPGDHALLEANRRSAVARDVAQVLRNVRDAHRRAVHTDRRLAENAHQRADVDVAIASARGLLDVPAGGMGAGERRRDLLTRYMVEFGAIDAELARDVAASIGHDPTVTVADHIRRSGIVPTRATAPRIPTARFTQEN